MGFNTSRFMSAEFRPRTEAVPVPALKDWFDGDDEPVWTVRGLDASELTKAIEAKAKNENVSIIVEAITGGKNKGDRIRKVQQALGLSDDTPGELAKRREMLVMGSVKPEIDDSVAVKLASAFPVEFYTLTNRITALTGMGKESEGKPGPSGEETKSENP